MMSVLITSVALSHIPDDLVRFRVEEVETPLSVWEEVYRTESPDVPLRDGLVSPSTIVNLAKSVWTVIDKSRPVAKIETDYASALPKGVTAATDLAGFSEPQAKSFRLRGENVFGLDVYDVTYTLVHQFHGAYRGIGAYLANVGVVASEVDVMWGYKIDLAVVRTTPVNAGTDAAPVAALGLELELTVRTPLQHQTHTLLYYFRGDEPVPTRVGG